jgi:hypothetical protein
MSDDLEESEKFVKYYVETYVSPKANTKQEEPFHLPRSTFRDALYKRTTVHKTDLKVIEHALREGLAMLAELNVMQRELEEIYSSDQAALGSHSRANLLRIGRALEHNFKLHSRANLLVITLKVRLALLSLDPGPKD